MNSISRIEKAVLTRTSLHPRREQVTAGLALTFILVLIFALAQEIASCVRRAFSSSRCLYAFLRGLETVLVGPDAGLEALELDFLRLEDESPLFLERLFLQR